MMEFAMTDKSGKSGFQEGIRNYLKKYEYQTVITENLWQYLNETIPQVNTIL